MKRMMILLVMALVMFSGSAFAAQTTLTVTAEVLEACSFNTAAADLDFGTLDAFAAPAVNVTGSVDIVCTAGTPYSVTSSSLNADFLNPTGASPDAIPYAFSFTTNQSGTGSGYGVPITVGYQADISAGAYASFAPDVYTDTVTLEILP